MNISEAKIGLEVVRSKGDKTGTKGIILKIEGEKAKVDWEFLLSTSVKISDFEPTSIAYEITPMKYDKKTGRITNPKYSRK